MLIAAGLAGCLGAVEPEGGQIPGGEAATGTFTQNVTLSLREIRSPTGGHNVQAPNCLSFPSGNLTLVAGIVRAEWTPSTAGAARLTLRVDEGHARTVAESKNGASPLEVALHDVRAETDWGSFDVVVMLDEQGAVVDQPVDLRVEWTYRGEAPTEASPKRCGRA